ncbi:MAG: hypothetical protein PUC15_09305 [Lentisphaeria bacterium]|nr:hypothetical protein [Lentisphaeria bacterium]MDD6338560.1 hypothetical protein [Lentisphaeria bacterium]
MTHILEAAMLVCFGFSWPFAIAKTVRAKNPAGKSYLFAAFVIIGYIAGSTARFMRDGADAVFCLYIFDMLMVIADTALCLHYRRKNALSGKP